MQSALALLKIVLVISIWLKHRVRYCDKGKVGLPNTSIEYREVLNFQDLCGSPGPWSLGSLFLPIHEQVML